MALLEFTVFAAAHPASGTQILRLSLRGAR
jgi:hypothetical protein